MPSLSTSFLQKRRNGPNIVQVVGFPHLKILILLTQPEAKEYKIFMVEEKVNDVTKARVSAKEFFQKEINELCHDVLMRKLTPNDHDQIKNFWYKILYNVLYPGASNVVKIYESLQMTFLTQKG